MKNKLWLINKIYFHKKSYRLTKLTFSKVRVIKQKLFFPEIKLGLKKKFEKKNFEKISQGQG